MKLTELITEFKVFCDNKYGTKSGTANSYTNAIKYLFEYLNISEINDLTFITLKSLAPDLKNKNTVFYLEVQDFYTKRGQSSYIEKGFVKASIDRLFEFFDSGFYVKQSLKDEMIINAVSDKEIKATFDLNKLRCELPLNYRIEHSYNLRIKNGTAKESVKKICNGRKAEKYFISYLKDYLGFKENKEFFDVANNKDYGYDIRLLNVGLEVKNIKSGGFYLTDNEIARIENTDTHLILVDLDNGIWLLKHNSYWLQNIIQKIKLIRKYCTDNYSNLDLTDIKINLDEQVEKDIIDISKINKKKLKELLK